MKILIFNENIITICYKSVTKCVTFSEKVPPWLNNPIKCLIKKKIVISQKYLKDTRTNKK